jgi:hypothetical protein
VNNIGQLQQDKELQLFDNGGNHEGEKKNRHPNNNQHNH